MKIESDIDIQKPPSQVFQFLLDKENITLWLSNFDMVEHLEGEEGEIGATYKIIFTEGSRHVDMLLTIVNIVENQLVETTLGNSALEITLTAHIQGLSENTTFVHVIMDYQPKTLALKLQMAIFKNALTSRHQSDVERLKQAIEMLSDN